MSKLERVFHAVLFEVLAVILTVGGMSLLTEHGAGALTGTIVIIASIAMVWNFVFNSLFDRVFTGPREQRSLKLRVFHTVLFELGLLVFTIPVVAYILQVDWITAFVMDIGMTLFVMVYALVFNWSYDNIRARILAGRAMA